jgi:ribosome-associated toxin RatA of RatAB toxin-antitoxin module
MSSRTGLMLLAALTCSLAWAERPEQKGHAPAELFTNLDGGTDTPGARYLATLTPSAREAVRKDAQVVLDQKIESGGPTLIKAVVRFDRPKAEVFALIAQPSEQHTFLPHVEQSKTFGERTAEGEANDYVVSVVFTFKYRTQHWFYPEAGRVEWALDPKGGDGLAEQEGYWQLYELDEKTTIGEYGTHLTAKGAILNFFRSLGERGAVADSLTAFRKHIDTAKP